MSISIYNSTNKPLLAFDVFEGLFYDNILEFAEINISINCDVGYTIYYIYSQDKVNIDFIETEIVAASALTNFIKKQVFNRYFKLKIEATDGDMTVLNAQTIYKTSITYSTSGIGADVNIISQSAGLAQESTLLNINAAQKTVVSGLVWNNAAVLLNGVSAAVAAINIYGCNSVSIFGNTDTTTTIAIQLSNDNVNYYTTQYAYTINTVGDFGFSLLMPFKYIRLINKGQNVNSIITYINCK